MRFVYLFLVLFACLLVGCSTGRFPSDSQLGGSDEDKGVAYLLGRRVPVDHKKAFYYFHKAARQGDARAQNEVAYMYAAGKGTEKNPQKAFFYYKKAAAAGIASAQYNLGMMYLYGLGTKQNRVVAEQWFEKSAANGFEPAKNMSRNFALKT